MQRRTRIGVIGGAVCCVILAAIGVAAAAEFEVTVTNLTRGQVFTPILVASHQEGAGSSSWGSRQVLNRRSWLRLVTQDGSQRL